jgi:putative membrane protein
MTPKIQKNILQIMLTALTLLVADYLMSSVKFDQPWVAIVTALVVALLNAFLKPLLVLLTLPVTMITLGVFLLVINAAMLLIADELVDGFHISGFWSALWLSIFISLVNTLFGGNTRIERIDHDRNHEF